MNKQELIERIKKLPFSYIWDEPYLNKEVVLEAVEQLDEPQKVKVLQFVADLLAFAKLNFWDLEDIFEDVRNESRDTEISKWFYQKNNMDILARAWLDGYEVEKEKRYIVKFKATKHYFAKDGNGRIFFSLAHKDYFTRKQLEEASFGWVFDCEGIEIEEVE